MCTTRTVLGELHDTELPATNCWDFDTVHLRSASCYDRVRSAIFPELLAAAEFVVR